jgi:hypothetical protein
MGRYICCTVYSEDKTVLKYGSDQKSEMHRINTEFNIGEFQMIQSDIDIGDNNDTGLTYKYVSGNPSEIHRDVDILTLNRSDIKKLELQIQSIRASQLTTEKWLFLGVVVTIRDFIVEHPEQDEFIFVGDL